MRCLFFSNIFLCFSYLMKLWSLFHSTMVPFYLLYKQHYTVTQIGEIIYNPITPSSCLFSFPQALMQSLTIHIHKLYLAVIILHCYFFFFLLTFHITIISDWQKGCKHSVKNAYVLVLAAITKYHKLRLL